MFTVVKIIALGHFSIFRELWFLEPYCSLGTVPWVWLSSSWPYFKTVLANSQTPKKILLVLVYIWFLRGASEDIFFVLIHVVLHLAWRMEDLEKNSHSALIILLKCRKSKTKKSSFFWFSVRTTHWEIFSFLF